MKHQCILCAEAGSAVSRLCTDIPAGCKDGFYCGSVASVWYLLHKSVCS